MINKLRNKSDRFWLAVPVASLMVISAATTGIVGFATGMFTPAEAASQTAITPPKIVNVQSVPMSLAMDTTVDKNDSGWGKRDEKKVFSQAPFPFSCASNVVNPSYSVSQGFNADGAALGLTINGYSAGLGALAFQENVDKPGRCVGGNTYVVTSPINGLGTEAVMVNSRRGSISSQTVVWRRGDIVGYLNTDNGNPVEFAKVIDRNLESNIAGKCLDEKSALDDAKRTVWSGKYDGYKVSDKVSIAKADLPKIPSTDDPKLYEVTPIPSDHQALTAVNVPDVPSYPVWPKLPTSVALPVLPKAPAANPPTEKQVTITKEDTNGPGCGWDFTGTVRPTFDAQAVSAANDDLKRSATAALTKESSDWSGSVLAYWKANKIFSDQAKVYTAYSDQVNVVSTAWAGIAHQWDTYNANMAIYNKSVDDNQKFLADQKSAQDSYNSKLDQCRIQDSQVKPQSDPTPTPSASPTATANPTGTPAPTVTPSASPSPSPSPTPTIQCPPTKPAILSQEAPKVLDKPQPPTNPIPANER